MSSEKAKKIFDKYNRASDVVRCPYGRASVRKELDKYARAAVNLYGIISRKDFVEIFNAQNTSQTTEDELYTLLLPLVLKEGWYGFYKDYLGHYWVLDDFSMADYYLGEHADKPRYVPKKEEFLDFIDEEHGEGDYWHDVFKKLLDSQAYGRDIYNAFSELKRYMIYGFGISRIGPIMEEHGIFFDGEEDLHEFVNLLFHAKNNTRIKENLGHTPLELAELLKRKGDKPEIEIAQRRKVGRNEPCPCGSGKKYKYCCGRFDDRKSAQLSSSELRLFYDIWYGLLTFVNKRKRVLPGVFRLVYPRLPDERDLYKVRQVLWENPELIDDYIKEEVLSKEEVEILSSWRKYHLEGLKTIVDYKENYALVLGTEADGEDVIYGVKGLSNSLANTLTQQLPITVSMVLLPFKGKIIYDGIVGNLPISMGDGMKKLLDDIYRRSLEKGIIESLD